LSTVRREEMTAATSLYTLSRRVGGNIGYALVATLIERFSIVHREHLRTHISTLSGAYLGYHTALTARLAQPTGAPVAAQNKALALADSLVNRQATMLAYNDIAWVFSIMFLCIVPFIVLFLRQPAAAPAIPASGHHPGRAGVSRP